jgi:hypothetical protein
MWSYTELGQFAAPRRNKAPPGLSLQEAQKES